MVCKYCGVDCGEPFDLFELSAWGVVLRVLKGDYPSHIKQPVYEMYKKKILKKNDLEFLKGLNVNPRNRSR
jgi:hypothetical protein